MRRTILFCALVCAWSATLAPSIAIAQHHHDHHGQGSYSHGGYSSGGYSRGVYSHSFYSHSGVSIGFTPIVRYPLFSYAYAPYSFWRGGYGGYWGGGAYLPPLVVPADAIYGPQPVLRMMGVIDNNPPPVNVPQRNRRSPPLGGGFGWLAPNANPVAQPNVRVSNDEAKARSKRFMQSGDERFRKQEFNQALGLYKQAITAAPDVAVNYFRQGLTLFASGRYDQAAKALKKGMSFDAEWPRSQFRLDDIYGNNNVVKAANREALAQAATAEPDDGDLLFLLGVILYFDGQPDRARPFFQRAHDLNPADRALTSSFLKAIPAPPVANANGVKL